MPVFTASDSGGRRPGALCGARAAVAVTAAALVLAACDPSPAARALKGPPDEKPPATGAAPEAATDNFTTGDHSRLPDGPPTARKPAEWAKANSKVAGDKAEAGPEVAVADDGTRPAFELLGQAVTPGTSRRLMWSASRIFEGVSSETPVLVVNGAAEGPTMCLTAAIHGDELNGIEMVRRVLHDVDPARLNGVIIGIPIVNIQGFRRGSRYLPDRRDLNRYFPGNPDGSSAARIAYSLFKEIILRCDALVDLHTGSFYRTNLPQLRADLRYVEIRELTQGFGGMVVLHTEAAPGTLRRAAADAGIPAVTLEAGEPLRLQPNKVSQGVDGIFRLLGMLKMTGSRPLLARAEPVFYESTWVRADNGGIMFSVVRLGQPVETGDVLGTVTDPITNEQHLIYSPEDGRVLGMALNQVVMPGFAAFRIGIQTEGPPAGNATVASLSSNVKNSSGDSNASDESDSPAQAVSADAEEPSEE